MNDAALPTPDDLRRWLSEAIACKHLQVVGDGRHFEALIVSDEFAGLAKIRRHQRVYKALGDRMDQHIHALSMKTLTPEEWQGAPSPAG